MNNNVFDFEDKVKHVKNFKYDPSTMKQQDELMDCNIMNSNFELIENSFNEFYEKIRIIEEMIEYSKIYINNEVSNTIASCKGVINEIEKMNDMVFSEMKNYTVTNVIFANHQSSNMIDRDGRPLNKCEIYNNKLMMSGVIKETVRIKNVSIISNSESISNNKDSLAKNEVYRSEYLLDGPQNGGVEEEITFVFDKNEKINAIKVKLANCKIKNIKYIYSDNSVSIDTEFNSSISTIKDVKAIVIKICCNDYTREAVESNINLNNKFDLNTDMGGNKEIL